MVFAGSHGEGTGMVPVAGHLRSKVLCTLCLLQAFNIESGAECGCP